MGHRKLRHGAPEVTSRESPSFHATAQEVLGARECDIVVRLTRVTAAMVKITVQPQAEVTTKRQDKREQLSIGTYTEFTFRVCLSLTVCGIVLEPRVRPTGDSLIFSSVSINEFFNKAFAWFVCTSVIS